MNVHLVYGKCISIGMSSIAALHVTCYCCMSWHVVTWNMLSCCVLYPSQTDYQLSTTENVRCSLGANLKQRVLQYWSYWCTSVHCTLVNYEPWFMVSWSCGHIAIDGPQPLAAAAGPVQKQQRLLPPVGVGPRDTTGDDHDGESGMVSITSLLIEPFIVNNSQSCCLLSTVTVCLCLIVLIDSLNYWLVDWFAASLNILGFLNVFSDEADWLTSNRSRSQEVDRSRVHRP